MFTFGKYVNATFHYQFLPPNQAFVRNVALHKTKDYVCGEKR